MKGTIKRIEPVQVVSDKFKKQELILTVMDGQYEQTISVEFQQDKIELLESVAPGQEVEVLYNVRGREWTSPKGEVRVFNTLVGWKIEAVGSAPAASDDDGTPEWLKD
jgi:single-strand DNA-binding protein